MDLVGILEGIGLRRFVAFDFETTHLKPPERRVIECSAVRYVEGVETDNFSSLVNPGIPIPEEIQMLTRITDEDVRDASTIDRVGPQLFRFVGADPMVSHNIGFDREIFQNEIPPGPPEDILNPRDFFDTLMLSRILLYFLPSHRLTVLSAHFNLPAEDAHRALQDARNAGVIFLRLLEEAATLPPARLREFLGVTGSREIPNRSLFERLEALMIRNNSTEGLLPRRDRPRHGMNRRRFVGVVENLPQSAREVFSEDGPLARSRDGDKPPIPFELRRGQIEYSQIVQETLDNNRVAVLEAGTGIGKSMGYLYPAIRAALSRGEGPVVISCHTRQLQDQLFLQELPRLVSAVGAPVKAVVMKGRRNYVCKTRLAQVVASPAASLKENEIIGLLAVMHWLGETATGELGEIGGLELWGGRTAWLVRSEAGYCTRQTCAPFGGCFLGPIREAAQTADLIIVNHALFIAERYTPGILPEFRRAVVDEAHRFVDAALEQSQVSFSARTLEESLSPIAHWKTAAPPPGKKRKRNREFDNVRKLAAEGEEIQVAAEALLSRLLERRAQEMAPDRGYPKPFSYRDPTVALADELSAIQVLLERIGNLCGSLEVAEAGINDVLGPSAGTGLREALAAARTRLAESESALKTVAMKGQPGWIYWMRVEGRQNDGHLTLNACPIDIGPILRERIFEPLSSVVLTSATLSASGTFSYVRQRTGLGGLPRERVVEASFPSPFLYNEQCRFLQYSGEVGPRDPSFGALIVETLEGVRETAPRNTLVLFTSRRDVEECEKALFRRGRQRDWDLFVQKSPSENNALLRAFRDSRKGVLIGVDSFWEGINLPRELLEIILIARLPFQSLSFPLVTAYANKLNEEGRNGFTEFQVPEAVIRFRQGFGRLIRSTFDEGIFIVMDNRVVTKAYGKVFSGSIPVDMQTFRSPVELSRLNLLPSAKPAR